jgi:GNAT superfamily N-acetyltransferase
VQSHRGVAEPVRDPTFPTTIASDAVAALERVEREASLEFYANAPANVAKELGLAHRRIADGALILSRKLDHIMLCRLQGFGMDVPATRDGLDDAISTFGDAHIRNWIVQLAPGADTLAMLLAERGFRRHPRTWAKFVFAGEPPETQTDLTIREIDRRHADAFGEVARAAFELLPLAGPWIAGIVGRPRFRTFMAFDGETPVACGTVFIDGNTSWLGFGATLASHRRRGAQSAILAARIRASREAGATLISTETGIPHFDEAGPSFRNIQRAGFRVAYERPNMRLPGDT